MKYAELKKLKTDMQDKKICLFGAGLIGQTWAYELLKAIGFHIDFYCDNGKKENIEIRDGVKTISLETLYSLKKHVLVFITVTAKHQDGIIAQLREHGISDFVSVDYLFMQTFIESLLEMNDKDLNDRFRFILDDAEYLSSRFEYELGYKLNLGNPQTFNEKLQWLKIHDRNPDYIPMVDKYEVKKYVADKIGWEHIIPTLGVYDRFDEINFDALPQQFVLKCTHDSGSIIVCKDKSLFHRQEARQKMETALRRNLYWAGREWPYKNVKPRIIAEQYIETSIDYKLMMFHGKLNCSFMCTNRTSAQGLHVTFYDPEWNIMPFERHYPKESIPFSCPESYHLMCDFGKKLSEGIPFVRVDFYEVGGHPYFGELTFYPGSGMEEFTPFKWDRLLGDWLDLPTGNDFYCFTKDECSNSVHY